VFSRFGFVLDREKRKKEEGRGRESHIKIRNISALVSKHHIAMNDSTPFFSFSLSNANASLCAVNPQPVHKNIPAKRSCKRHGIFRKVLEVDFGALAERRRTPTRSRITTYHSLHSISVGR